MLEPSALALLVLTRGWLFLIQGKPPTSTKDEPSTSNLRMLLNMGGDDITEFLYVLLERISFPYRDTNLSRWYDWNVMEDLKARLCTLAEVRSMCCAEHV
jgi:hypothetical protein